jgi:cysteine desulfurase
LIYFDHNASTPVRPEVAEAMTSGLGDLYANPSSLHREGQRARAAIERARVQVAALVNAHPDEVVFTSGGTEGDHLAILGAAWARAKHGTRVAISAVEHHAVHGAAEVLADQGWAIDHLPVGADGRVDPETIELRADTVLVSLMLANNETGVIQRVGEIARLAHAAGALAHCDAVQAAGKIPIDFRALGVDYLVVSAHKIGGPKGAGALVVRRDAPLAPLFRGSGHEHGRRGGTENLTGIVGLGVAAECAARDLAAEAERLGSLRRRLEAGIENIDLRAIVHGAGAPRLPNTVNVSFPGARSDRLLMALDAQGIAVSAGAACASGAVEPSPVLSAMGVSRELAVCAVRLSMGRTTTEADVDAVIDALRGAVRVASGTGLRALASSGPGAPA